jgi:hypothetical protein
MQMARSRGPRFARRRRRLRLGLWVLALGAGLVGVWAVAFPSSFWKSFPGIGFAWVSKLPPYNEHLVRDVGGLNLAFFVLFAWCALSLDRRIVRAVLLAWLFFAVPHFVFHLFHLGPYSTTDAIAQMIALGISAALPVVLLGALRRLERPDRGGGLTLARSE